ncbi:MAG: hypothetical protein JO037_18520 [Actinobacteria bacterium]|nr:hypothetical protein [Actinomycetota bacterium]
MTGTSRVGVQGASSAGPPPLSTDGDRPQAPEKCRQLGCRAALRSALWTCGLPLTGR